MGYSMSYEHQCSFQAQEKEAFVLTMRGKPLICWEPNAIIHTPFTIETTLVCLQVLVPDALIHDNMFPRSQKTW